MTILTWTKRVSPSRNGLVVTVPLAEVRAHLLTALQASPAGGFVSDVTLAGGEEDRLLVTITMAVSVAGISIPVPINGRMKIVYNLKHRTLNVAHFTCGENRYADYANRIVNVLTGLIPVYRLGKDDFGSRLVGSTLQEIAFDEANVRLTFRVRKRTISQIASMVAIGCLSVVMSGYIVFQMIHGGTIHLGSGDITASDHTPAQEAGRVGAGLVMQTIEDIL